jgi:hypothetical protein
MIAGLTSDGGMGYKCRFFPVHVVPKLYIIIFIWHTSLTQCKSCLLSQVASLLIKDQQWNTDNYYRLKVLRQSPSSTWCTRSRMELDWGFQGRLVLLVNPMFLQSIWNCDLNSKPLSNPISTGLGYLAIQ